MEPHRTTVMAGRLLRFVWTKTPSRWIFGASRLLVLRPRERKDWTPMHRLDSGITERFWKMNRKYGWWGLAFVESLVRLADWCASANAGTWRFAAIAFW